MSQSEPPHSSEQFKAPNPTVQPERSITSSKTTATDPTGQVRPTATSG
ncbi:hypothetical protein BFJ63_vAg19942 [Fusarium oxysporum f. sp. narcissi]|uniref:Uncharacterized protein n=1 Tax=Fusarium oxysporum f. sp. narcissi TaxID=451672 RepID=A0A4Q2UTG6_FUSOX|nr:hypothetical protein BFJ63_vAg19942 [Fusarium oxysporum f. sp. narcissi]